MSIGQTTKWTIESNPLSLSEKEWFEIRLGYYRGGNGWSEIVPFDWFLIGDSPKEALMHFIDEKSARLRKTMVSLNKLEKDLQWAWEELKKIED